MEQQQLALLLPQQLTLLQQPAPARQISLLVLAIQPLWGSTCSQTQTSVDASVRAPRQPQDSPAWMQQPRIAPACRL
jgi:hypothetical protein